MSKKMFLFTYTLLLFALICYLGIEYTKFAYNDTLTALQFVNSSINSVQKYLAFSTILLIPYIYMLHTNYLSAEIKIRLSDNAFYNIIENIIKYSVFYTIVIVTSYYISSVIVKLEQPFEVFNVQFMLNAFFTTISMFVIKEIFYLLSGKLVVGLAVYTVINFIFLITILGVQYAVVGLLSDSDINVIYSIFIHLINVLGSLYLYINLKTKELV